MQRPPQSTVSPPTRRLALTLIVLCAFFGANTPEVRAEYGDIVINNYSDASGMRPVVFPHWFHRIRYRCKVCHTDLGFKFKAGGNDINMVKVIDGQFCGACHNGDVAWNVENCNLCHSAMPGTPTQVHESTVNSLLPAQKDGAPPLSSVPGGESRLQPALAPTLPKAPRP